MKVIDFPSTPLPQDQFTAVPADKVVEGAPSSAFQVIYSSASEEFTAGLYECTAGKWRVSYAEDEFCTLLEGRLRMTSDDGTVQEYAAPSSFLIPSGYAGWWEPLSHLRKFFVIYEKQK